MAAELDEGRMDEIAEEFAARLRAGERPAVDEYAQRYPAKAPELRAVLSAVAVMEQAKARSGRSRASKSAPAKPPDRVGKYRLLREIGRGGMGVVYEAEQEGLGRRVAVKLLPAHLFGDDKVRARFRREAIAAGRLHHTNIVPVFGVGEEDGHSFYVMQLIQGRGLDEVIRQTAAGRDVHHSAGGASTRRVRKTRAQAPTKAGGSDSGIPCPTDTPAPFPFPRHGRDFYQSVARIGLQVAEALGYAHSRGIVHRDIKPSNLLLDATGVVWVTDFGVAKVVETAALTRSGDFVGTLRYMPPERFAGQSDGRGDVYSLGISLWELLALKPAFPDTSPHHLIQIITTTDPAPPSTVDPEIPTDLETIVLKAVARDPARRYQTPGDLADDLRRFLDDRPVKARRTGPFGHAWRWCRRNRSLAAATAAVALMLVAVTVVSAVGYARTRAANRIAAAATHEAESALAAEKSQKERVEAAAALALDALNRTYDRFAPTRLVATPPATSADGVELPPAATALPPEAVLLLEDLLRTYEKIAQLGQEFPRLRAGAAEANHRIGDIRQRLGKSEAAGQAYRAAIELYTRMDGTEPGGDLLPVKKARAYNELGRVHRSLHQFDDSIRMHNLAVTTLTTAGQSLSTRPECRYELACSYYAIGLQDPLLAAGGPPGPKHDGDHPWIDHDPPPGKDRDDGLWGGPKKNRAGPPKKDWEPKHDRDAPSPKKDRDGTPAEIPTDTPTGKAVALLVPLVAEFPGVPEYRHLLARCYRDYRPQPHRHGPGPRRSEQAVELLRQLVVEFPRVPDYRFDLCETLAQVLRPMGAGGPAEDRQASEWLDEAVRRSAELVAEYPTVPDYAAAHARYLDHLGVRATRDGRLDVAEKSLRRAIELQTPLVAQHPRIVGYALWLGMFERSLGETLGRRGQYAEARQLLESAVHRFETLSSKETRPSGLQRQLGRSYRNLSDVYHSAGEPELAQAASRKAQELDAAIGPRP